MTHLLVRPTTAGLLAALLVAGCAVQSVAPPPDERLEAGVVSDVRPVPDDSTLAAAVASMLGGPAASPSGRVRRVELIVALDRGGAVSIVSAAADGLVRGTHVRVVPAPDPRVIASP